MLVAKSDVNASNNVGGTALMAAALVSDLAIERICWPREPTSMPCDRRHHGPVDGILCRPREVMRLLLAAHANLNVSNTQGATRSSLLRKRRSDAVRVLIAHGVDVNAKVVDSYGRADGGRHPLMVAAEKGHSERSDSARRQGKCECHDGQRCHRSYAGVEVWNAEC